MEAKDFRNEYQDLLFRGDQPPGLVYGPVESRRFGGTVGINLLGTEAKVCSFDCPYCDLGRTQIRLNRIKKDIEFPPLESIDALLREKLRELRLSGAAVDSLLLSGNGEPTLYPALPEAIQMIAAARAEYYAGAKITILTNGAHLDSRKVIEGLNMADERIVKMDAGSDKMMKLVNAPLVRSSISKIISGTRNLKDLVVQSFFVRGVIDNTAQPEVEEWIEVIGLLRPKIVHIQGLSRVPATSGLEKVDEDTLYTIASRLERKTHIKSLVFP